jgi:hypothetical protein
MQPPINRDVKGSLSESIPPTMRPGSLEIVRRLIQPVFFGVFTVAGLIPGSTPLASLGALVAMPELCAIIRERRVYRLELERSRARVRADARSGLARGTNTTSRDRPNPRCTWRQRHGIPPERPRV